MTDNLFAEAIVVGAGPAGMGTALSLARQGVEVIVLEKMEEVGSSRRGETIRYDEEMDSLLGGDFFARQTIKKINRRTYFSHTGLNSVSREISNPNLIISWPDFLQSMRDVLLKEGVKIMTSSQVTGFLEERGRITGVIAKLDGEESEEKELKTRGVFSCGGHQDPATQFLNLDRSSIDLPVFKQLINGYAGPADRLEYFFHVEDGSLAISTIFPRADSEAEIILMGYPVDSGKSGITMEGFCKQHPLFKDRISGADVTYSLDTFIPMGGMLDLCSPRPGLMLTGDAMGHVQARGGSGIKASFMIGYTAGQLCAPVVKKGRWSKWTSKKINKKMEKSKALKSLRKHNFIYSKLRFLVFNHIISTPQDMDRYWPVLKHALR